ncbi:hypothetical protein AURDEDRAFT_178488 [Auricularia subglabra TFB-10046 SS5]|uniref:Uncharacterized protein n=1 Tax=Auricularia subglabra (strain TFB-10046 / SS5) TaxID=717982 RepID=J0D1J4_AURST|nr:hypothetical protein AURDEDRAFT_178488 [Auricularia subglabra TFB-10046 SS5]
MHRGRLPAPRRRRGDRNSAAAPWPHHARTPAPAWASSRVAATLRSWPIDALGGAQQHLFDEFSNE